MIKYELAVIIVNYKTPDMVLDALASLQSELISGAMKAIIVDNHSQDNSVEKISQWILENDTNYAFELIESGENAGFSGGNNLGINAVKADFYLLLNSDTLVRKGAIAKLLNAANSCKDVGIVGARLEWPDSIPQESCFRFHTPQSELIRSASVGLISQLLKKYTVAQPVSIVREYCQWISFACVLIKSEVIDQVGLLDDEFFMYFEDTEFSYRACKAGWRILYEPDAHVVHLRGGSSPLKSQAKLRKRLPRYFYESRTRYFYLLYGHTGLFLANLCWSIGALISDTRAIIFRNYQSNTAEAQWLDTWINFTKPLTPYIHPENYV